MWPIDRPPGHLAVTPAVAVTSSVAAPVWGQPVSFTATVTAAGKPVTSGTVQWSVNGTQAGAPVPVGADGTASLGPLTNLAVGTDQITADYLGTDQFNPASGTGSSVVGKAATTTTVIRAASCSSPPSRSSRRGRSADRHGEAVVIRRRDSGDDHFKGSSGSLHTS